MKRVMILITAILLLSFTGCKASPEKQEKAPKNHAVTYNGIEIAIDAEAEPIIAALGGPSGYTEEPSCASDGVDKTYNYGSFYLSTYSNGGTERISRIWFEDDGVSTQRGIHIGSSKSDVEQTYKILLRDQVCYSSCLGNSIMTIIMENDVVTSILYDIVYDESYCDTSGCFPGCAEYGGSSGCFGVGAPAC